MEKLLRCRDLGLDCKSLGERDKVTSSDAMNLSDVFSVSPRVRALPNSQNTPPKFLCQIQVPMFPKKVLRSIYVKSC